MAVAKETPGSRKTTLGKNSSSERLYTVTGTTDEHEAIAAIQELAPVMLGTWTQRPFLWRDSITVQQDEGAIDSWRGTVSYAPREYETDENEESFQFDTSGGTQHITQSIATTAYPETAPDQGGAIGVTKDGVEGVDITVSAFKFSQTKYFSNVSAAYMNTLRNLTGKTNNATFKGFAAGEVKFDGVTGGHRGNAANAEKWELTFNFEVQPSRFDFAVGTIEHINKVGWDYMDIRYEDVVDEAAQTLVKKPVAVYIHQVYERDNFANLGIGT